MEYNATDKKFLTDMIPHLDTAIKRCGDVIANGQNDWVKQIAVSMADRNLSEKRYMEAVLKENIKEMKESALVLAKKYTSMEMWKGMHNLATQIKEK